MHSRLFGLAAIGVTILIAWASSPPLAFAQPDLVLTEKTEVVNLNSYLALLEDPGRRFSFEYVDDHSASFVTGFSDTPNFGYTGAAYWVRFTVRNEARVRDSWILLVDEYDMSVIDFFDPLPGGGFNVRRTGTYVSKFTNSVRDLLHAFRITLPAGESRTYYLRLETDDTMVIPLFILSDDSYAHRSHREWLMMSLYLGMLLIMASYNGLLYLSLRDVSYLYFVGFLVCLSLLEFVEDGMLGYLFPQLNIAGPFMMPLLIGAAALLLLLFTQSFLQITPRIPLLRRLFIGLIGIVVLWMALSPVTGYRVATEGNNILLIVGIGLCIGSAVLCRKRGYLPAILYLKAWLPLLLWVGYYVLAHSNIVPYVRWIDYGQLIAVMALVLLLSWSLVERIRDMEARTVQAQVREIQQKVEALRLQDELNVTLRKSKLELEGRVAERTDALERANAQLQEDLLERERARLEREGLIAELGEKNAELERFTYTVSHDLKSPLFTVVGFLSLLEEDLVATTNEQVKNDIDSIRRAVDKMRGLLNDLLALSRIGRIANPTESLSLDELVRETIELLAGPLSQKGIAVEIEPSLPVVRGDRVRILEVFQNLIENAIKFVGDQPAPHIEISSASEGDTVVICVRDNGLGIDPRYQDKVFGLFERLDGQTEGTGIGLALVKRIVEVHGGKVWVESEGEGHGAAFFFTLPMPSPIPR